LESRCQDYESSIREIQPKYQEALNDRGQFESEVKLALERESQMRKQRDARDAELRRVKDQMDAVDAELTAARLALTTSTNPQVAELSKMKDEVNRANEETKKLQSRLANMQQDNEYMRTQYQNASDAAVESASDLRDAQALVVELRKRADGNKVRVHEIQRDNENAAHLDTIKELKAENEELLRELEKKDAELKAMLNGRRATRGTSVPRSPRMGGTMSPGTPRPIGRVLQSSGSRGNSPAPGEFPPNRMGGFGEALFQGPSGPTPARWGNHLQ
jgi:chromosome segregation ATPase